ncbi:beta strand repeat-containing protein [Fontivita pretiosa]|uniref:beta strand repeat-containing protein n=1 Tax=Fontivita pretiosa TaxID=2989684 RepID=UPI003D16F517
MQRSSRIRNREKLSLRIAAGRACAGLGALIVAVAVPAGARGDITTGLTHYYTFDESSGTTAFDTGSSPSNGTLNGGVAIAIPGVVGNAYYFDGINDYVNTNSAAWIPASGEFSLFMFVQTSASLINGAERYLASNNNAQGGQANLGVIDSSGIAGTDTSPFWSHDGAGTTALHSNIDIADGRVHLLGVTRTAAGTVTLYVDNVPIAATTLDTGSISTGVNWLIGARATAAPSAFFNGVIDDVRVYNRALPGGDVGELLSLAAPATGTAWDGGGVNANWSTAANWAGDVIPDFLGPAGAPIRFTAGAAQTVSNNDIVNAKVAGLTFEDTTSPSFTITGNGFTLNALTSIANYTDVPQTVNTTGAIVMQLATIDAAVAPLIIGSPLNVGTLGTATLRGIATLTINGQISGSANIDKRDEGDLHLNNASNNFTGTLTAWDGVVFASSAGALGPASGTIATGGGMHAGQFNLSGVSTAKRVNLGARVGEPQTVVPSIVSSGNVTLSGPLSIIGGGTLVGLQANAPLTISGNVTNNTASGDSITLVLDGVGDGTISGAISNGTGTGQFGVTKIGTGTWTLASFANTFTGPTNILAGTLKVRNAPLPSSPISRSTITINPGATLDVSAIPGYELQSGQTLRGGGRVLGSLTAYDDSAIVVGDDALGNHVGTLSVQGNLTIWNAFAPATAGNNLNFDLSATPNVVGAGVNDLLEVSGTLTLDSLAGPILFNINPIDGALGTGTYTLITHAGGTLAATMSVQLAGGNTKYRGLPVVKADVPGVVYLDTSSVTAPLSLTWTGGAPGAATRWDTNGAANFNGGTQKFFWGDSVTFDDTATTGTVELLGELRPAAINVNNGTLNYAFNSSAGSISGSAVLTKSGAGNLLINDANNWNWTGAMVINGGAVQVNHIKALPLPTDPAGLAGAVTLNGGTLRYNSGSSAVASQSITLGPGGGTIEVNGTGTLALASTGAGIAFTGTGARVLTLGGATAGTNVLGAAITDDASGSTALVKNGSTGWTISGDVAHTGGTTVNAGTLTAPRLGYYGGNGFGPIAINGGTARVTAKPAANDFSGTTVASVLTIAGGATPTARLDLNNNSMIIVSGDLGTTTAQIKTALENGGNFDWQGPGIGSTQANVQNSTAGSFLYGLGVLLNDLTQVGGSGPIYTDFAGVSGLGGGEVLIKFTYFGDADLSGSIDATDYSLIDNGYVNTLSGWINGDFDYSGVIDATDYALIDNAYVNQAGPLAEALIAEHTKLFGGEYVAALRAVQAGVIPEPASLGLLLGAAWSLQRPRRAQNRRSADSH